MKNFIIKVINFNTHGTGYTQVAENALNNPPQGYEVFTIMYNPAIESENCSSPAAYRIVYKLADIAPEPIKTPRKFKFEKESQN